MSKVHRVIFTQKFPVSLETIWEFMSHPRALEKITPQNVRMDMVGDLDSEKMYAGQIIQYKLYPLAGIKLTWVTEITQVKEKEYFVDTQPFGPFAFWHHKHHFKAIEGGVLMTDIIDYKMPFGILGTIAHALLVKKKLQAIFDHRYKAMEQLFGKP
ncbi:MAG TPA: SRPBCC family protein [Bacteroidia bacterium]